MDASSTHGKKNLEEKRIREQRQRRRQKLLDIIQPSPNARRLYDKLMENFTSGRSWKSPEVLAKETGISVKHLPRYFNELEDLRLIRIGKPAEGKETIRYAWLELLYEVHAMYALAYEEKFTKPYPLNFAPEAFAIPEPFETIRKFFREQHMLPLLQRKLDLAKQEFANPNSKFASRFCEKNKIPREAITEQRLERQCRELEALESLLKIFMLQNFNWKAGSFEPYTRIDNSREHPPDIDDIRNFFWNFFRLRLADIPSPIELPEFVSDALKWFLEQKAGSTNIGNQYLKAIASYLQTGKPMTLPKILTASPEPKEKIATETSTKENVVSVEQQQPGILPTTSENPKVLSEQKACSNSEPPPPPPPPVAQTLSSVLSNKHRTGLTSTGELLGTLTTLPPLPKEKQVIRGKLVNEYNIPFEQADDLCRKHNFEELKNLIQELEKYANQH